MSWREHLDESYIQPVDSKLDELTETNGFKVASYPFKKGGQFIKD